MAIRIRKKGKSPAGAVMAIIAGGAVAASVMLTPAHLIEMAATASGLPGILPAAAPPLGETARLILAFACGTSGMVLVTALHTLASRISRRRTSAIRIGYDIGYEEDADEPVFSRTGYDAGAEPRRPLFASSELAGVAPLTAANPVEAEDNSLRLPMAPEPLAETELELGAAMAIVEVPTFVRHTPSFEAESPVEDPAGIVASLRAEPADYSALSITDLVDRFERGLKHRRNLVADAVAARKAEEVQAQARAAWLEPAQITPPSRIEPERKSIDAEVDEALRAALGTLQRMTARAA